MNRYTLFFQVGLLVPLWVWLSCMASSSEKEEAEDLITVRPASKEAAKEGHLTGEEVLLRSVKAYAKLRSYQGTVSVESRWAYKNETGGPSSAKVKITFSRPKHIRVEGVDSSGKNFTILSDGDKTWKSWELEKNGAFEEARSLKDALIEFQGVGLGACTKLSAALLPIEWSRDRIFFPKGQLLSAFATQAKLEKEEKIKDQLCYRVVCERQIGTWTFWVDKDNFLLRQVKETTSPEQMAMQRKHGGGGASGKIQSSTTTETFTIDWINRAVDKKNFEVPQKKDG